MASGTDKPTPEITVYDIELGPYARIVRLQLTEKGIAYKSHVVQPLKKENIQPWYAKINPAMTVPSLAIQAEGEAKPKIICDSRDIIDYFENKSHYGPSLVPSEKKKEVWDFVDQCYDLKLSALYIGNFKRKAPAIFDTFRATIEENVKLLEEKAKANPELKDVYEKKKEASLENRAKTFDDPEAFPNGKKQQAALMAEAEKLLSAQDGENAWLFGSYSIADVVFTCMLCGLKMFDLVDFGEYPSVAKFYERVKKRPSYKAAKLSESFPMIMNFFLMVMVFKSKIKSIFGM